jgi:hypothetical protein
MKIEDILNALPAKRLEDLLGSLPSKDDLAHAVGLQVRQPATDTFAAFGIFGAGLLLGAGLALLFAPKPGNELRHELAHKGQDLAGKVGGKVGELGERLGTNAASLAGNGA